MPDDKREREAALEAVVRENAGRVLSLALRMTGDANAAQDVSQDVFASVWRAFRSGGGPASWPAYLHTATVRNALTYLTKRAPSSNAALDAVEDRPHRQPDASAELRELQGLVRAALAKLPDNQALTFALVKLEGLSYRECAEALGCSEDAARVHAHRAMLAVARELRSYAPHKKAFDADAGGGK
jgi:RNA polymerase sigma factor (sigma-70 family)